MRSHPSTSYRKPCVRQIGIKSADEHGGYLETIYNAPRTGTLFQKYLKQIGRVSPSSSIQIYSTGVVIKGPIAGPCGGTLQWQFQYICSCRPGKEATTCIPYRAVIIFYVQTLIIEECTVTNVGVAYCATPYTTELSCD